ncbi:hypothetical protein BJV78DRAFT_1209693 [Lactifluus subvellereus]|nr:hypothetical protein BJV78DRAFT_1209693 [Lactifluus subvellereus]
MKAYLIIDEFSMSQSVSPLNCPAMCRSANKVAGIITRECPLEGSMLCCAEIWINFPRSHKRPQERLYHPTDLARDSLETQIGRTLYEEFDTIVILKQQIRITDSRWRELLNNLRKGQVQQEDLQTLREFDLYRRICRSTVIV